MSTDLSYKALQLNLQQVLACESCPACFGPRPINTSDYPASTQDRLVICLDGNFQHCHHIKASSEYEILRVPRIFIHQDKVEEMSSIIDANPATVTHTQVRTPRFTPFFSL
jgi:hypothetical protein